MSHSAFEEFEAQLHNTLNHFYDPLYHPDKQVFMLLQIQPDQGMEGIRQTLRNFIERLKPEAAIPSDAPSRRFFEVLNYRYLASVSQEEVAYQLGMTPRNLRRIQQKAVSTLAQLIWNQSLAQHQHAEPKAVTASGLGMGQSPILRELEVLQLNSPGAVADLAESLERVQAISLAGSKAQTIEFEVNKPFLPLTVAVHPSILDQILLSTLEPLGKQSASGIFHIQASQQENMVELQIISTPKKAELPYMADATALEMVKLVNGTQSIDQAEQQVKITFRFPAVSKIPILLIDDNLDFFHLFRRYTQRTRYTMHNIREGAQLQQALTEFHPKVIILDVLLPDVDGWQLLLDLQNPTLGQTIPVIVCSALGQKDLAYSLGAKAYLPKPVSRDEFLQALDAIL